MTSEEDGADVEEEATNERSVARAALCSNSFAVVDHGEFAWLQVPRMTNVVTLLFGFFGGVLIIIGCIVPTFSSEVRGIITIVDESGRSFAQSHGVFSIIDTLRGQIEFLGNSRDTVGLILLILFTIFGVLVIPLLLISALLVQWFYPLQRKWRARLDTCIEAMLSVEYIEVYLLSAIICALQLDDLSFFLVNDYCAAFNGFFAAMAKWGVIDWDDAQCLMISGSLDLGSVFLLCSVIGLLVLAFFVQQATKQKMAEDEMAARVAQWTADVALKNAEPVSHLEDIREIPILFTDRFRWCLRPKP